MAESSHLKPFLAKLESSIIYQALSGEKKARLISTYQNASEEQLRKAAAVLQQREAELLKIQADKARREQELQQTAEEIRVKSAELEKLVIEEGSARDKEDSLKQADKMLAELDAHPQKKAPVKKTHGAVIAILLILLAAAGYLIYKLYINP